MSAESAESLLAPLVEHMAESVAIYDREARVLYANAITARMFGRTLDEMRGRVLWEMFPDAIGNPFHAAFLRVVAGGAAESFDHYYAPWDRWFANRIEQVGEVVHVVARDVTEELRGRRRIDAIARTSAVFARHDAAIAPAMQDLAVEISSLFGAACSLRLMSADARFLERVGVAPESVMSAEELATSARMSVDSPLVAAAIESRQSTLWVRGDSPLPDFPGLAQAAASYGPAAVIVAPLVSAGTVIGAVVVARDASLAPLTEDDRRLAGELASSIGLYLARALQHDKVSTLEQRLSSLADALPALVSFVDRDGRYLFVNAQYERWFEVPRSKYIGRVIEEVVGPEDYRVIAPHVRAALAGIPTRYRWKLRMGGSTRDVDVSYSPVRTHGEVVGFAALVLDVTLETQLAEAERRRFAEQRLATDRMDRLLGVAARLAVAQTTDEVAVAVVDAAADALDAPIAGMWLLSADGSELVAARTRGFAAEHLRAFARMPLTGASPVVDSVTGGEPLWISSRADYADRYPGFEQQYRPADAPPLAFGSLPIFVGGHVAGSLTLGFHDERRLTLDERAFLEILASHAGDALQRARLYADLRDAGETQDAMIRASPAAIMLLDTNGIVQSWNPAAERIFGWSADQVIGKVHPTVPAASLPEYRANLAHVASGNVLSGHEARRLRATGEWFDVELFAAPIRRSTGETHVLAMVADVSERKRIERGRSLVADVAAELARSLDWEAHALGVVQRVIVGFADWCCVDLLEGEQLRRIAPDAGTVDGAPPMPMRLAHDPERGGSSAAIATGTLQLYQDLDDTEIKRIARDDTHAAAIRAFGMRSLLSMPLKVGARTFGAFSFGARERNFDAVDIAIATDIANQTAMAIENARLYQQAQDARRDAETASKAKDQFLAMLGHELRNPLAPITAALELMTIRTPELTREREVIARQVAHLTRLVDDLLDVSRIARGTVELDRTRVSVTSFVARGAELARPLLDKRQHRLTIDVPENLEVDGDPTRLAQIVSNLLTNAARYSDAGASTVVTAVREGDDVVLRVKDTGFGIAPEVLPTIFDVFVQAPQTIARTTGGLGLGLTIVRNLVELHGGSVTAHSDGLGHGAELVVRLPLATTAVIERAAPAARAPRNAARRRVLIVDDNQDAATLLAELLDGEGHEIRTAFDGESALQVAHEFRPDVAVLDLGLPQMDGYELARQLRGNPIHGKLRLIALTGYSQASDHARSLAAGFDQHLAKPVEIETLARLVEAP